MDKKMIKYTVQKMIQTFGIVLTPLCGWGAYLDGSWFGMFCSCYIFFLLFFQDMMNNVLEKELYGRLY